MIEKHLVFEMDHMQGKVYLYGKELGDLVFNSDSNIWVFWPVAVDKPIGYDYDLQDTKEEIAYQLEVDGGLHDEED